MSKENEAARRDLNLHKDYLPQDKSATRPLDQWRFPWTFNKRKLIDLGIFLCHSRCLKVVELCLSWIQRLIGGKWA